MKHSRIWVLPVLTLVLALPACGKKAPAPAPAPAAAPAEDPDAAERARREAEERARREAEERARREAEEAARRNAILTQVVYFDYDQAVIRPDAREALGVKLPILREDTSVRLRIEGHADERGSTEYNMALGLRRAESVKEYFTGFGLNAVRFEVISFGEERPASPGHDETAWSKNRRAEFRVLPARAAQDR